MKILYLITSYGIGGASIQLHRMCNYMLKKGHEVILVTMLVAESQEMVEELEKKGALCFSLEMKRGQAKVSSIIKLVKIINKYSPDIINSHMVHANFLARIVKPFIRHKNVIINTIHGEEEYLGKRRIIYKLTNPFSTYTVCVGEVLKKQAVRLKIAPINNLKVIYNGLDTNFFAPKSTMRKKLREKNNIDSNVFIWINVGRYEKVKNQAYLIKEFKNIVYVFPNTKLFIVGYGTEMKNLYEIIKQEGLTQNIELIGKINNVEEILNMADAFVLSSIHEGLPLTLQEAGAVGLPLVSTDVGGCSEIIEEGVNGYLCVSNKPGALSQAMLNIMKKNKLEVNRMGEKSREIVVRKFDHLKVMEEWENLYAESLNYNH